MPGGHRFYGLLVVRNMIKVVVALQILVKAAVLAFILAGNRNGFINEAQTIALTVIVADTIVAVLGLALQYRFASALAHWILKP